MMIQKQKSEMLKILRDDLKREPKAREIVNAETDVGILMQLVLKRLTLLEADIAILKKK